MEKKHNQIQQKYFKLSRKYKSRFNSEISYKCHGWENAHGYRSQQCYHHNSTSRRTPFTPVIKTYRCRTDWWGLELGASMNLRVAVKIWEEIPTSWATFSSYRRTLLWATLGLLLEGYQGFFVAVNSPRCKFEHSLTPSAEVKTTGATVTLLLSAIMA